MSCTRYVINSSVEAQTSGVLHGNDFKKRNSSQAHSKRKRKRSKAASQEKERLKVFNEALDTLQSVLPVRLPKGRKLHKKQTLQLASCYIQFLQGCLKGTQNWKERHRFLWCTGAGNEDILNAIDAAAVGVETSQKGSIKDRESEIKQNRSLAQCISQVEHRHEPRTQLNPYEAKDQYVSGDVRHSNVYNPYLSVHAQPCCSTESEITELPQQQNRTSPCGTNYPYHESTPNKNSSFLQENSFGVMDNDNFTKPIACATNNFFQAGCYSGSIMTHEMGHNDSPLTYQQLNRPK